MHILILGGGVFLGAHTLEAALGRGHGVTVLNRGRARSRWPAGVETLAVDRRGDLGRLAGRRFDAVIDTCGYVPADLRSSTAALRESGAYLFVSSISAYDFAVPVAEPVSVPGAVPSAPALPIGESHPLAAHAGIADDDRDAQHYGAQKAACEAVVTRACGERALIVRPGLIVGPGDPTGRFSHWPWRTAAGGAMLVPDVQAGAPLQCIDVRDLARWMVELLEHGARGAFNGSGPCGGAALGWPALLGACRDEALARDLAPAQAVPVAEAFLLEHAVGPWSELPLWLPTHDAQVAGLYRIDTARAAAHGLRTRPLRETVGGVLDEGPPPAADDPRRVGKLSREREAALLAAWAARGTRVERGDTA